MLQWYNGAAINSHAAITDSHLATCSAGIVRSVSSVAASTLCCFRSSPNNPDQFQQDYPGGYCCKLHGQVVQ